LSFDDGPSNPEIDRAILETLRKHAAHGIWFINCRNLDPGMHPRYRENRQVLQEILRQGHQIGNHGYNHLNLVELEKRDPDKLRAEIVDCNSLLRELTGKAPELFRPPWGQYSPGVTQILQEQHMKNTLWGITSIDTGTNTSSAMADTLDRYWDAMRPEDGDIILFHDSAATMARLDRLLTRFDSEGYTYVLPD